MPSWQPARGHCRKPCLHKHLLSYDLLRQWNHQPVQCNMRPAIWNPDHWPRLSSRIHVLCLRLSQVCESSGPEVYHVLRLCKLHHSHFSRLYLRADLRFYKLPVVLIFEWNSFHLPAHLYHLLCRPAVLHCLPSRQPARRLCRKPCLHHILRSQHLCAEWFYQLM